MQRTIHVQVNTWESFNVVPTHSLRPCDETVRFVLGSQLILGTSVYSAER